MSAAEKKRESARRTYCDACVSAVSARNDADVAAKKTYDAAIAAAWTAHNAALEEEGTT